MARGDDIEERLIDFAVMTINLCVVLPTTVAGRHVAGQLVRSGTAPAPNYSEARGAESTRDFIHKLGICLKELNESAVWLKIALRSKMSPEPRVQPVLNECVELSKIINSSIQTARRNNQ
jgi:four helix bundle protein